MGQLAILAKLVGDGRGITGGRRGLGRFIVRLVVIVVLGLIVVVVAGSRGFAFVVGLVVLAVGFVGMVGLVTTSSGFLSESFPVTGVDGVCEMLHVFERHGFALLAHDILDAFGQTRIVAMTEYTVIPAGTNSESVELYVVLDYVLVVVHLEVVDAVFCVSSGIDRAKLDTECTNESGPVVHPVGNLVGV